MPIDDTPAAADLDDWAWDQYRLESNLAGQLGSNIGSLDASRQGRTLIAEYSRSKLVVREHAKARYGVAARLIVHVTDVEAKANLTLPFVAAQAQFNQLEAYATLAVTGYAGDDLGDAFPDFAGFDVETYVKLMESLSAMRKVLGADPAKIRPQQLWVWADTTTDETDQRLSQGVATAYALTEIEGGHPQSEAIAKYRDRDDSVAQAAIEQTYAQLVGDGAPSDEVRARAKRLLDGYKLKHPLL